MRLEPVYLLAPKPKPPSVPTRRAFLLAGSALLAGLGVGGGAVYAAVASPVDRDRGDKPRASTDLLQPSGNAELDELRRLAVAAPIAELMRRSVLFLDLLRESYPEDPVLWLGVERIADEVLLNAQLPDRRMQAGWLRQVLANVASCPARIRALAPALARIR